MDIPFIFRWVIGILTGVTDETGIANCQSIYNLTNIIYIFGYHSRTHKCFLWRVFICTLWSLFVRWVINETVVGRASTWEGHVFLCISHVSLLSERQLISFWIIATSILVNALGMQSSRLIDTWKWLGTHVRNYFWSVKQSVPAGVFSQIKDIYV